VRRRNRRSHRAGAARRRGLLLGLRLHPRRADGDLRGAGRGQEGPVHAPPGPGPVRQLPVASEGHVIAELVTSVRQGNAILFAGAGVSMNLGLPSWSRLIAHMAEELGYDPDIFSGLGDYLALAEYYHTVKGTLEPLRHWMQTAWHRPGIDIGASEIHRL